MNVLQALRATRAILAKPESWTTGVLARDAEGYECGTGDEHASCLCLMGAIYKATGNGLNALDVFPVLQAALPPELRFYKDDDMHPLAKFNDTHSHADVLALIDRAIEKESEHVS